MIQFQNSDKLNNNVNCLAFFQVYFGSSQNSNNNPPPYSHNNTTCYNRLLLPSVLRRCCLLSIKRRKTSGRKQFFFSTILMLSHMNIPKSMEYYFIYLLYDDYASRLLSCERPICESLEDAMRGTSSSSDIELTFPLFVSSSNILLDDFFSSLQSWSNQHFWSF